MNVLHSLALVAAEDAPHRDSNGQIVTHHWLWPEQAELIYGTIASLIIFALLWKFAGPVIVESFRGRTARVQADIDGARQALEEATADAERIRAAKGDIDAERSRLFSEADAQAEALLADGRARLDAEVAELESRAAAELVASAARAGDEMRLEIGRIVQASIDPVVAASLDATADQNLIEAFIQRVGAGS
jgi:F-type H+-transporting ATPase subunit b